MQSKSTRQIRLQGKSLPRIKEGNGYKQVPWLTLSGIWLEAAGFKAGDQVEILVKDHELLITKKACHGDQRD